MTTKVATLGVYEFGRRLLATNDLDPVYVALHAAKLPPAKLRRWLLSYFCFYHCGTASWLVDQRDYWDAMRTAAGSKEYPRCHERRHFRGALATRSVDWLAGIGVEELFQPLIGVDAPLKDVMEYVKSWYGFGDWIAFKVADMLERLGLAKVRFDSGAMFLFDSPRDGAELMYEHHGGGIPTRDKQAWAVDSILRQLGSKRAPPRYERGVNVQEAETILCKWKSHVGGHYTIGEDIRSMRLGLLRFAKCPTSQALLMAMRSVGLGCVAAQKETPAG